jgi:hypothetical protein
MIDTKTTFDDIAFAVTADTGKLGYRAAVLINSLREKYSSADIFNFIPKSSYTELSSDLQSLFESETTVITGEIPISEYPHSCLQKAFVEAAEQSDNKYIAALDTDTICLSKIKKPEYSEEKDLFLKSIDIGQRYWGSSHSEADWRRAYSYFGKAIPKMPTHLVSDVDNTQLIAPYYQGAVVITANKEFPLIWLEMTRESVSNDIYEHDEERFHDQIALGILSQEYNVGLLSEEQNFPGYANLSCPDTVQLLHYVDGGHLYRFKDCRSLEKISTLPEFSEIIYPPNVSHYYRLCYENINRIIPYPYNQKIHTPIRLIRSLSKYSVS